MTPRIEVIVQGDPMEMGLAQGACLREKIQSSTGVLDQLEAFRILQPAWMPYRLYRRIAEGRAQRFLEPALLRDFPDAHLRMKGIAAGAGVTLRLLQLLHALEPMLSDVTRCANPPALGGCSAVAVRGRRSATGKPVIARNFDYLPLVQPLYTLRDSRPKSGLRSLDFTLAPYVGAVDGLNEKGLCITYDYAYATDSPGTGTAPISVAIAEALERCSTVAEAVNWICSRPRWGGGILMLADAEGDLASLELSSTRSNVRRPCAGEDVLFHSNAFFTDELRAVEIEGNARYTDRAVKALRGRSVHESSHVRDRRFKQLLAGGEFLDAERLARIMADHETDGKSADTAICKHSDYWNTTATLQLFPAFRRMRVSFDSACRAKHEEFVL
jgi:hypothetical protein